MSWSSIFKAVQRPGALFGFQPGSARAWRTGRRRYITLRCSLPCALWSHLGTCYATGGCCSFATRRQRCRRQCTRTARTADMSMANALHLDFSLLQCQPWFEWVPSKANPADVPSRQEGHHPLCDDIAARPWEGGLCVPTREMLRSDTLDWAFPLRH